MSNWTGLGIGTKNSDGDWIEMFFAEENISAEDLESSDAAFEKVSVSDDKALLLYRSLFETAFAFLSLGQAKRNQFGWYFWNFTKCRLDF